MSITEVQLISDPSAAAALLDPKRLELVSLLTEPGSASSLSRRTGLPRQKVNYHLKELEKVGLVDFVEERKKGNCTERIVRARARRFVVDPGLLGSLSAEPGELKDRMSWRYLIATATRMIRDLATLRRRADAVGKSLQTLTLSTDICFSSQAELNAFSEELSVQIAKLASRYQASKGRTFRFVLAGYPKITKTEAEAQAEAAQARHAEENPS